MTHSAYGGGVTPTATPRLSACVGALVASALLSGCAPVSAPTPTPTPLFSSEDEAFAAAEETYREYNDASNARRAGDNAANPEDYLVGTALEADLVASDYLRSQGLKLTGTVVIIEFQGLEAEIGDGRTTLTASVCLDSSGTRVIRTDGVDVTPPERVALIALRVQMVATGHEFRIEDESEMDSGRC